MLAASNMGCSTDSHRDDTSRATFKEIRPLSDFSLGFRVYSWHSPPSPAQAAAHVLEKLGFMFVVTRVEDKVAISTSSTPLAHLPDNLLGRISLLIEIPTDQSEMRIHVIVEERPRLSSQYRPAEDSRVLGAADAFVTSLIDEFRGYAR
jgi:hypothetical protein